MKENTKNIEALLKEEQLMAPLQELSEKTNVCDLANYETASKDVEAFWTGFGDEFHWFNR